MAIPLVGSSTALFPRLGRIGKIALLGGTWQTGTIAQLDDLLGRYPANMEWLTGSLAVNRETLTRNLASGLLAKLSELALATVKEMVRQDEPARVADPLAEVIRQMVATANTVPRCAVTVAATADGSNTSDAAVLVTATRGDGLTAENLIAEAGRLVVTSDSRTGGTVAGAESLRYTGVANTTGVWDVDYPQGSGASTALSSADAASGRNSVLSNGGFDVWASGVPTGWTATGTPVQETSTLFGSGAAAVRVVEGTTVALSQLFGSTTGTASKLSPTTTLGFSCRIRGSAALSGGTLAVSLVDGTGTVLNDAQGNAQTVSFALNGTGTTWVAKTGALRVPPVISPPPYSLRVTVTAPAGGNLILDHMAAIQPTALYVGGPGVAVFGGAVPAVVGDGWTVTGTNDRASAAGGLTWQAMWNRLFATGTVAYVLPSSASPTIADSLISS